MWGTNAKGTGLAVLGCPQPLCWARRSEDAMLAEGTVEWRSDAVKESWSRDQGEPGKQNWGIGWVERRMITGFQLQGRVKAPAMGVDVEAGDGWVFTGRGVKGWKPGCWRGAPPFL